jgi:hypothetical protein
MSELAFVLKYGRIEYRTGVRFFFLGERQIPVEHLHNQWVQRLIGMVALVSSDKVIITVYKHKEALRMIRKKSKLRLAC